MKGSIEYLRAVRGYCEKYNADCKVCPLGEKRKVDDNICPRVVHPMLWSDELISDMVKIKAVD
jgi:hypothetical protein